MRLVAPRRPLLRLAVSAVLVGGLLAALLLPSGRRFAWERVWGDGEAVRYLLGGFAATAWISLAGGALGLLLGLAAGLGRLSRSAVRHQAATLYVEVVRGTPFLVQVMVAYYCIGPALRDLCRALGAPGLGAVFDDAVAVGVVALGVCSGAYVAEIVRAAVESVDRGQTEAALAQGMTWGQVLRLVLLPQALRRMLPPLTGELVTLIKDSSILSVIAVSELAKRSSEVSSRTYLTWEVLLPMALLYLALTVPLSHVARRLEARLQA